MVKQCAEQPDYPCNGPDYLCKRADHPRKGVDHLRKMSSYHKIPHIAFSQITLYIYGNLFKFVQKHKDATVQIFYRSRIIVFIEK